MRKTALLVLGALSALTMLPATAQAQSVDEIVERGKIVIGVNSGAPCREASNAHICLI